MVGSSIPYGMGAGRLEFHNAQGSFFNEAVYPCLDSKSMSSWCSESSAASQQPSTRDHSTGSQLYSSDSSEASLATCAYPSLSTSSTPPLRQSSASPEVAQQPSTRYNSTGLPLYIWEDSHRSRVVLHRKDIPAQAKSPEVSPQPSTRYGSISESSDGKAREEKKKWQGRKAALTVLRRAGEPLITLGHPVESQAAHPPFMSMYWKDEIQKCRQEVDDTEAASNRRHAEAMCQLSLSGTGNTNYQTVEGRAGVLEESVGRNQVEEQAQHGFEERYAAVHKEPKVSVNIMADFDEKWDGSWARTYMGAADGITSWQEAIQLLLHLGIVSREEFRHSQVSDEYIEDRTSIALNLLKQRSLGQWIDHLGYSASMARQQQQQQQQQQQLDKETQMRVKLLEEENTSLKRKLELSQGTGWDRSCKCRRL